MGMQGSKPTIKIALIVAALLGLGVVTFICVKNTGSTKEGSTSSENNPTGYPQNNVSITQNIPPQASEKEQQNTPTKNEVKKQQSKKAVPDPAASPEGNDQHPPEMSAAASSQEPQQESFEDIIKMESTSSETKPHITDKGPASNHLNPPTITLNGEKITEKNDFQASTLSGTNNDAYNTVSESDEGTASDVNGLQSQNISHGETVPHVKSPKRVDENKIISDKSPKKRISEDSEKKASLQSDLNENPATSTGAVEDSMFNHYGADNSNSSEELLKGATITWNV